MAETLTIKPRGMGDYRDGELEEIATAIREAAPDLDLTVQDPRKMEEGRYGVIFNEILDMFFSASFGYAFNTAVNAAVRQARQQWEERQKKGPTRRPRTVSIHGPDGRIIKSVRIDQDEAKDFDIGRLEKPEDDDADE